MFLVFNPVTLELSLSFPECGVAPWFLYSQWTYHFKLLTDISKSELLQLSFLCFLLNIPFSILVSTASHYAVCPCGLGDISESVLSPHPKPQQCSPAAVLPITGWEGACLSVGSVCSVCPDNCNLPFTVFFRRILLLPANSGPSVKKACFIYPIEKVFSVLI